ncbi:GNAT family N-acetyltransferase [Brevundimonas faecalis]|uniref:GNAT family acetyltransferase n=1 Tax=Brevundimonas faecalis TaxID=947378 RepID=A0ABV2R8U4_9CAUL
MSAFRDLPADRRYQQEFADETGVERPVWADYAVRGEARVILHVEAHPALRGSGAASRFMQALADHARAEKLTLIPHCSYAVAWLKRHPEYADVTA